MLVMRTPEDPTHSVSEFVSTKQFVGLDDFALAVNPLRLDRIEPRTLLGQKATYNPHSSFSSALFDFSVVLAEPSPRLTAYMPARVVPDENQHFLASRLELFATPREEPGRYGAYGPVVHEPQPRLVELRQIETVARYGLRLGVVL